MLITYPVMNLYYLTNESDLNHPPVSRVMRRDLETMPAIGLSVAGVGKSCPSVVSKFQLILCTEAKLHETPVSGYPIVSADGNKLLHGYIGKSEIKHVLSKRDTTFLYSQLPVCFSDKYRTEKDISSDTPCSFLKDSVPVNQDGGINALTSGPALGIEEDDGVELSPTEGSDFVLRFWPWANQVYL